MNTTSVHKLEKARVTEKPSLHMMRTVHIQRAWKEERIQNQVSGGCQKF